MTRDPYDSRVCVVCWEADHPGEPLPYLCDPSRCPMHDELRDDIENENIDTYWDVTIEGTPVHLETPGSPIRAD